MNFPSHRVDLDDKAFGAAIDAGDKRGFARADIDFSSGDVIYGHGYTTILVRTLACLAQRSIAFRMLAVINFSGLLNFRKRVSL